MMTSEDLDDTLDWHLELDNFGGNENIVRPQPEVYNDESIPYDGQKFDNDEEAYNFYFVFAKKNGFSIRRERVVPNKEKMVVRREFVCHRGGVAKSQKVQELDQQRKRKSSRCNCNARMWISKKKVDDRDVWLVTHFNNSHNHELLDEKEVRFLPAYRDIHPIDQERILLLSKAGCSINLMMRVLELEKGIDPGHLSFMEKDIRNFLQSQSCIGQENDAAETLKLCKTLKDKDDDFKYDFTLDDKNKLEHIIWAFGDSIRAYELFGDVIVFDTTYQINRYNMPLGIWIGVDNHGKSIFFGCVLLRNEKTPAFTWALKRFSEFVKGKYPQTILTDQDLALKEAISTELPYTKHAFCIWHIVGKLSTWFSLSLGLKFDEFKSEFYRLYHLESIEDFENQWSSMVAHFGLHQNKHIILLYSNCECWALAYLKDFFFAGMTTTGRSESINSYVKGFLDTKTNLIDFVNQVGIAVSIRNQAGEEARMRQKYLNTQVRTYLPIEEHAAKILTPYAFELLQHEIEGSFKYASIENGNGSYIVRHCEKSDGGRIVSWLEEEKSISCSCKEFEFSGILCRHAIRVLVMKNYFTIPEQYLLVRWRRESSLDLKFSHVMLTRNNFSQQLHSHIKNLEYESLKTRQRLDYATTELERLICVIKDMPEIQEQVVTYEQEVLDSAGINNTLNGDGCNGIENPSKSITKGRPRGSRAKGRVEVAKKVRYCHYPNCGGTGHDARTCPNKKRISQMLPSQSPNKISRGWGQV